MLFFTKLQLVQNAAERFFSRTTILDYIPVKLLIDYKILLMVDKAVDGLVTQKLIDFLLGKGHSRVLPRTCNLLLLPLPACHSIRLTIQNILNHCTITAYIINFSLSVDLLVNSSFCDSFSPLCLHESLGFSYVYSHMESLKIFTS